MPIPSRVLPVAPQIIDGHQQIHHSFQADVEFQEIHTSSAKAKRMHKISPGIVGTASRIAEITTLPPIERVVATGPKSRFMIFSFDAPKAEPPGPRIFGLNTSPDFSLEDAISLVRPLVKAPSSKP